MPLIESGEAEHRALRYRYHRTAFVTLVMLDDGYIPGAILLAYSLRQQHSEFLLICMVTNEVSAEGRKLLTIFFDRVVEVDKIFVPCRRMKESHYLPYVFTKLNVLRLGRGGLSGLDLKKVIFIDADVLPLRNYGDLVSLNCPAGIINEYRSHLALTDRTNNFQVKTETFRHRKWHWHNIYDPICPHGTKIPTYITDQVKYNTANMGVNGALLVLEPSREEYDRIVKDLKGTDTKDRVRRFCWPEMQYLTIRWSGRWTNIDIRFCGFKGYPSVELLYGTHFAGVKPWKILDGRSDLYRRPDFRVWYDLYLKMYSQYSKVLSNHVKYRKLQRIIKEAKNQLPEAQTEDAAMRM